jgi:hypothetical protein
MNEIKKLEDEIIEEFLKEEKIKVENSKKNGDTLETQSENNPGETNVDKTVIVEQKRYKMNSEVFKDILPLKEETKEAKIIKPETNEELKSRISKFLMKLTEGLLSIAMKEKVTLLKGYLTLKSEPLEERRKYLIEKKTFVIERISIGDLIFKDLYIYSPKDHEIIQKQWSDILDYINVTLELLNEMDTNTKIFIQQNNDNPLEASKLENTELKVSREKIEEILGFKLDVFKETLDILKKLNPKTIQDDELLNTTQAAEVIGYTPQTLRKMIKSGEIIPHKWVGKRPAFLKSELLDSKESGKIQKYKRN